MKLTRIVEQTVEADWSPGAGLGSGISIGDYYAFVTNESGWNKAFIRYQGVEFAFVRVREEFRTLQQMKSTAEYLIYEHNCARSDG